MGKQDNGDTIVMSTKMLNKLILLNTEAKSAVSLVGGNSVQDGYRNNTIAVLNNQLQLLEVFTPDE